MYIVCRKTDYNRKTKQSQPRTCTGSVREGHNIPTASWQIETSYREHREGQTYRGFQAAYSAHGRVRRLYGLRECVVNLVNMLRRIDAQTLRPNGHSYPR